MPVAHIAMSDTTVAVTSTISGIFACGFCFAMDLNPAISLGIGVGVGIFLYATGVVPIGALIVLGVAMLGSFFGKKH